MSLSAGLYAANCARSFPLRGDVTGESTDGDKLPEAFIADLQMRFNGAPDDVAYVLYAASADEFTTILIGLPDRPLATATIATEAIPLWTPVPLVPLDAGVQGAIVFGNCSQRGEWEFQDSSQSGLSWRAAQPQATSSGQARMQRHGVQPLVGPELRLLGDGDLRVTTAKRDLGGQIREAIVISLQEQAGRDVIAEYTGACGRRPESRTCGSPQPVESIDQVQPDCCGRLFIEFRGCVELTPILNHCGVVITCDTSVEEACPSRAHKLPDGQGNLPTSGNSPENEPLEDCEPPEDPAASGQAFPE